MKKSTILFFLLTSLFFHQKMVAQVPHFEIIGNIKGADGEKFVLNWITREGKMHIDTATVVDKHFNISGEIKYPQRVRLAILSKNRMNLGGFVFFFLENSTITITTELDSLTKRLKNTKIEGSQTNDEYTIYLIPQKNNQLNKEEDSRAQLFIRLTGTVWIGIGESGQKISLKNTPSRMHCLLL